MIRRTYSPPYQARAPQLGADDIGRTIKGLVTVEVARTNEVTFAVESFGCDGKPILSPMRGLGCELPGKLTIAGTKNGMPFRLGADLPRGVGSAIRGSGGGMVNVTGSVALATSENVIYDNYGNYWSTDQGATPVYLGETPPLASGGDGVTPALCVMDPKIRPHEIWNQWLNDDPGEGGGEVDFLIRAQPWRYGWTDDSGGSPVYPDPPIVWEYTNPAAWRIEQWIPDETTAPDGTGLCGVWPTSKRRALVYWSPTSEDPHDHDALDGGRGTIVSAYPTVPDYPPTVPGPPYYAPTSGFYYWLNQWTRPAVELISVGGITDEAGMMICVSQRPPAAKRIEIRNRYDGTSLAFTTSSFAGFLRSDHRYFFTPKLADGEGWYAQNGVVTSSAVKMGRYHSRVSSANAFGTAVSYRGTTTVTLPIGAAHAWDAEPVWFRAGRVTRYLGSTPRVWPLLPKWS